MGRLSYQRCPDRGMGPDQWPQSIAGMQHAQTIKFLSVPAIEPWYKKRAMWRKMVDCVFKRGVGPNFLRRPHNHFLIKSYTRAACGSPLGIKPHPDPDEGPVNEKWVVVNTSTHSINRRHRGYVHVNRFVIPRYHSGWPFLQAHAKLSLCLTGGYTHNLTEEGIDERLLMERPDHTPGSCGLIWV